MVTYRARTPRRQKKTQSSKAFRLVATVKVCEGFRHCAAYAILHRAIVLLMAISQEICVEKWVVEKRLKNDIQVAGLSEIKQSTNALLCTRTSVGIAPNVHVVVRAFAESTFFGNYRGQLACSFAGDVVVSDVSTRFLMSTSAIVPNRGRKRSPHSPGRRVSDFLTP